MTGPLFRWASLISSFGLILSLNLILFLDSSTRDLDSIRPILDGLVGIIDPSLVISSALLGAWFWRAGRVWWAIVFGLNLVEFAVGVAVRLTRGDLPFWVLSLADLYWLNLYLICLARHGASLARAR